MSVSYASQTSVQHGPHITACRVWGTLLRASCAPSKSTLLFHASCHVLALTAGLGCLHLSLQTLHYFSPGPLLEVLYTGVCECGPSPGASNVAQATFWVLPE